MSEYANKGRMSHTGLPRGERFRRLRIDRRLVSAGFGRDERDRSEARGCYLNVRTGRLLWLPAAPEHDPGGSGHGQAAGFVRPPTVSEPYLEIPPLSRVEHEKLLRGFLSSQWTDDAELRFFTALAYDGSIEHWMKRVPECALSAFERFKSSLLIEIAETFLEERGIRAEWR